MEESLYFPIFFMMEVITMPRKQNLEDCLSLESFADNPFVFIRFAFSKLGTSCLLIIILLVTRS